MKRAITAAALIVLAVAVFHTKTASRQLCPSGYSLIDKVCISDTTGDVVLPTTPN